ncbi:hypothetical protein B0H66DRAFT_537553 [Apodospora peruviana]|uniref:Uncharacterized protein n=1 Tax=Apodospora peruviana TaxID=516989 RepID=A0AAE0HWY5_9PEZI|nr:hypothetical protein B0H66DRAFT_537553 [Apodospora peruviana]
MIGGSLSKLLSTILSTAAGSALTERTRARSVHLQVDYTPSKKPGRRRRGTRLTWNPSCPLTSVLSSRLKQVEACRQAYDATNTESGAPRFMGRIIDPAGTGLWIPTKEEHQNYLVRPLFRALLIVVDSARDYQFEMDSQTVGDMRVSLVRTGIEDGLSAAVTFDTIHQQQVAAGTEATATGSGGPDVITTRLRVAIDFVIALEDQERAAVSTCTTAPSAGYLQFWESAVEEVKEQEDDFDDQEPVRYPSSRLVSDEKAAKWGLVRRFEAVRLQGDEYD